jgi:hypothetical protein
MRTAFLVPLVALGCSAPSPCPTTPQPATASSESASPASLPASSQTTPSQPDIASVEALLVAKHGEAQRARIRQGLTQIAALWREEDGDLAAFAQEHFLADPAQLDAVFRRLETTLEQVEGHMKEISREVRRPADTDIGPMLPVDPLLAAYEPAAHLNEDLFRTKIAFVALLNFPAATLTTKNAQGDGWSRRRWAEDRLTARFARRVPAEIRQQAVQAETDADLYIADYNIWMHHVLDQKGKRLFAKGKRLISHWNLRDELKASYGTPQGIEKQRIIVQVMNRIVTQTIPAVVIDNPRVDWNPFDNSVQASPAEHVEENAPASAQPSTDARPEPDVRYAKMLACFQASRRADPYSPMAPTAMARKFDLQRELSEQRVRELLVAVLESPLVGKVAARIEKDLGRKLEPQDLWYAGFKARGGKDESQLDALTKKKYPNAEAFARDIPNILQKLGFSKDRARYVADHIVVDPSRGAGHAMEAGRRGDKARLRTRVEKEGMNYKGYNIAVHELGHNVEQVLSLYDVDHTLLAGVPNTAFTEALAFVFQARDLELLGVAKPSANAESLRVLDTFWSTWEIAGVALVDIDVWHWMYEHPNATPTELREATLRIARAYWNKYYTSVLGQVDTPLLGIYSHMIVAPLYLADYPLGHLIAFQIEEKLNASKARLGPEFERVATYGSVLPDLWMRHATGQAVSAAPLLRATARALEP